MHRSWRNRRSMLLLRTSFLLCQRTILPCLSWVIVQPLLLGKWRRTRHPRRGALNNNSTSCLLLPGVIAAPPMLRCLRPTQCRRWHKRSGLHVHLWTATRHQLVPVPTPRCLFTQSASTKISITMEHVWLHVGLRRSGWSSKRPPDMQSSPRSARGRPPRGSEVHAVCRSQVEWIASLVFSDSTRMVEAGFRETGLANQTRLTMNVSVFCLSLFLPLKSVSDILSRPHEGRDGFFHISECLLLVTELHR